MPVVAKQQTTDKNAESCERTYKPKQFENTASKIQDEKKLPELFRRPVEGRPIRDY
jgi:hypothetical protein